MESGLLQYNRLTALEASMPRFSPPFIPWVDVPTEVSDLESDDNKWNKDAPVLPPAPPRSDWPSYDPNKPGRWHPEAGPARHDGEDDFTYEYRCYHASVYWASEDAKDQPVVKRGPGRPPKQAYPGEPPEERRKRQQREAMARYRTRATDPTYAVIKAQVKDILDRRDALYEQMTREADEILAKYEASCRAAGAAPTA